MSINTFILPIILLFLTLLGTAVSLYSEEPTDILPARFYGRFSVDSRTGWFNLMSYIPTLYPNVPIFSKWLDSGLQVRHVERTGNPRLFNIIEGTRDKNTTFMLNVQLNVLHRVDEAQEKWIIYYLKDRVLYHQMRDINNEPVKDAPLIGDKFLEDNLIEMETTIYYDWDGERYKEAKRYWRRSEEKPFFEKVKHFLWS